MPRLEAFRQPVSNTEAMQEFIEEVTQVWGPVNESPAPSGQAAIDRAPPVVRGQ